MPIKNSVNLRVEARSAWGKKFLQKTTEDDPASCISWNHNNLTRAADFLNNTDLPVPEWIHLPATANLLALDILTYVAHRVDGGGAVHGDFLIGPNNFQEFGRIMIAFATIGFDETLMAIPQDCLPLGHHYSISDKSRATAVPCPILPALFPHANLII